MRKTCRCYATDSVRAFKLISLVEYKMMKIRMKISYEATIKNQAVDELFMATILRILCHKERNIDALKRLRLPTKLVT